MSAYAGNLNVVFHFWSGQWQRSNTMQSLQKSKDYIYLQICHGYKDHFAAFDFLMF